MILDLVPSHKYAEYSSNIGVVYAISLCVGPLIGGAITEDSTWRWIFLLKLVLILMYEIFLFIIIGLTLDSVPAAAVTAVVIALSLPNGFPYHGRPLKDRPNSQGIFSKKSLQRLDFPGTALLLITCIFLVAALEMGGVTYPWKSAFVSLLLTSRTPHPVPN